MKNLVILIIVSLTIYLGLVYKGAVSDQYVPDALKEKVPQLNQSSADEEENLPLDQRMHTVAKNLLSPLNSSSGSFNQDLASIMAELKNSTGELSPEAISAGLKFCKQLESVHKRKMRFLQELNEIKSRKEIKSNMKSRDSSAQESKMKDKLVSEKIYNWDQVIKGVSPQMKKQLATFMQLMENSEG